MSVYPPVGSTINPLGTNAAAGMVLGQVNDQFIKVARVQGEFPWHTHALEDEMFLVVKGKFRMEFRDHDEWIGEGEFIVVPRGVEHRPVGEEECWIMLFEPPSTLNTGNVKFYENMVRAGCFRRLDPLKHPGEGH